MTGAELKQVVSKIDDDATILGVNASHGHVKRHLATFYPNMAMDITFEVCQNIRQPVLAEEVLAKARAAAKTATSHNGLFETFARLVCEAFPDSDEMEGFAKSPQANAMRSILKEAETRFGEVAAE